eukprot:COSAG01_NODE_366_length_18064_cov_35.830615_8_plen_305_part_00
MCRKCFLFLASAKTTDQSSDRQRKKELEKQRVQREAMDHALEQDMITAKSYLRGLDMQLESALVGIGHRTPTEKTCYLVRSPQGKQAVLTLLTLPKAPQCPLVLSSKSARSHLRNFAKEIDHPFIFRAQELAYVVEKRCLLVFREFAPRGSLKDRIHRKANPKQRWAAKYGFKGDPLSERLIALFCKQILEAMAYFQVLGLPCTGCHTGNIIMRASDWVQITEFENAAVGLAPFKPNRVHASDTLAFGHVLYEMATGAALESAELVSLPAVPLPIQEILHRIFRPDIGDGSSPAVSMKELLRCE